MTEVSPSSLEEVTRKRANILRNQVKAALKEAKSLTLLNGHNIIKTREKTGQITSDLYIVKLFLLIQLKFDFLVQNALLVLPFLQPRGCSWNFTKLLTFIVPLPPRVGKKFAVEKTKTWRSQVKTVKCSMSFLK